MSLDLEAAINDSKSDKKNLQILVALSLQSHDSKSGDGN